MHDTPMRCEARHGAFALGQVSRPEYYGVPQACELTTYFETDAAVRTRDERD